MKKQQTYSLATHCSPFRGALATSALLLLVSLPSGTMAADNEAKQRATAKAGERPATEAIIAGWPERPRLGAQMMISQYGAPQEVTSEKLVWHDQGPYKCITVTKKEHHHDFPKPHMDFVEHTIMYLVPDDKADSLSKYDGSCTFDRTRGTMSARCDLEGHNILTLNLANDIVTGKMNAAEARKAFGQIVAEDMLGKHPAYVEALQFTPGTMTEFVDRPVIPGSPMRPDAKGAKPEGAPGDGEILGFIGAINEAEIVAAMVAAKKAMNSPVGDYAKMLHQEHGKNLEQTLKLGQKIDVTPLETAAVDALRVKCAGELAALVPLKGEEFTQGYLAAMVKGHTEVLGKIDNDLLPKAENDALKKHLTETRQHIVEHLAAAKKLQGRMAGAASDPTRSPVRDKQKQQKQQD